MKQGIVLTGDIVGSTRLGTGNLEQLLDQLAIVFKADRFEVYRGDSFQVLIKDRTTALHLTLLARITARNFLLETGEPADIRISMGIGEVPAAIRKLATAQGEAFVLSGRGMEQITGDGQRLLVSVPEAGALQMAARLLARQADYLVSKLTGKQSQLLLRLLEGQSQKEAAVQLGKSNSTVSQLAASAEWSSIQSLLEDFQELLTYLDA